MNYDPQGGGSAQPARYTMGLRHEARYMGEETIENYLTVTPKHKRTYLIIKIEFNGIAR